MTTPIYFDHAATSWPKPDAVVAAVCEQLRQGGGNPGRSGHRMSIAASRVVMRARECVAQFLGVSDPSRVAFAPHATHALNLAMYGLLRPGDHVVTTSLEHNSVMRPLRDLESAGVAVSVVPCDAHGVLDLEAARRAMTRETRLVVATHASNVTGTIMPIEALARLAHAHGALMLVDAAQTAGALPINIGATGIDLLAFTGHKGLMGPTGTGGLYVREGVPLRPLVRGGTGSDSAHERQPDFMPDAFESGTCHIEGLAGLGAAVEFITDVGLDAIRAHEQSLVARFLGRASEVPGLIVYGPPNVADRTGVISVNLQSASPSEVGLVLDETFGIMVRVGLHCAPAAHATIGTMPTGTVRFSVGWFNTLDQVDRAIEALRDTAAWAVRPDGRPSPATSHS